MKSIPATGQQLVRIGLMTDIPDNFVPGCVKNIMKGYRQLNRSQTGGQMAAGFGYHFNDGHADFFCQLGKILARDFFQIKR